MRLIVAKFGGTSVGTIDRIKSVAKRIKKEVNNGYNVIVVVSAMSGETNRLINLVKSLTNNYRTSEYDIVVSSGEQVTSGLIAIALNELGIKSKSYQSWQIQFETDNNFSKANIENIKKDNITSDLKEGYVIVVPGFQGIYKNRITTLGRGGSDTSAVALANNGYQVELHEELEDVMMAASDINQYRLHKGYHYPRSKETAQECLKGLYTFKRKYERSVVNGDIEHYYAIASEDSKVSEFEYLAFLDDLELPYERVKPLPNTDVTIKVEEELFDNYKLYELVRDKLWSSGVEVLKNKTTTKDDFKGYDVVVIATYAKLNDLLDEKKWYQYELCEKPVVRLPKKYQGKSIVIMDGPFMCLDPYGEKNHVLGNVKHAIHCWNEGTEAFWPHRYTKYLNKGVIENPKHTKIDKFIETGKKFFKDFDKLKHIGSMYTIRTVLANRDHDDARPTLVNHEGGNVYSLFSGKIDTCVDSANELIRMLNGKD